MKTAIPIAINRYTMLSIRPVFFLACTSSSLALIPSHSSTLLMTLLGIILRLDTSMSPCRHVSKFAGINIARSGICVSTWRVFISANIYFMASPRTPASTMFPATDPVSDNSTNIIDLVTKLSATIDYVSFDSLYKKWDAGVVYRFGSLGSRGVRSCSAVAPWRRSSSRMLAWGYHSSRN